MTAWVTSCDVIITVATGSVLVADVESFRLAARALVPAKSVHANLCALMRAHQALVHVYDVIISYVII